MKEYNILYEIEKYLLSINFKKEENSYSKYLGFGRVYVIIDIKTIDFIFSSYDEEPFKVNLKESLYNLIKVYNINDYIKYVLYNIGQSYIRYKMFGELEDNGL